MGGISYSIQVGPNVNTRFLMREARRSGAEKQGSMIEGEVRLLKMEEGAISQGMRWPLEAEKDKETDAPLNPPKGM